MEYLRLAKKEDIDMVYGWSNDPVTRSMSFNTEPIPYENHVKWFERVIEDTADMSSTRRLLILVDNDQAVGQMRLDLEADRRIVLSYSMAPQYRGLGYGSKLINLTCQYVSSHLGIDLFNQMLSEDPSGQMTSYKDPGQSVLDYTLVAEVKKKNAGSIRMLEKNGFALDAKRNDETSDEEVVVYTRAVAKPIYIRVDMNKTIATGHVMRCLSIADAAAGMGIGVSFICADDNPAELIRDRGYEVIILNSQWDNMESEFDLIRPVLESRHVKHLLVDSYQVTKKYLENLRQETEVTYIDDVNSFVYPVDKLIVYANYYTKWALEGKYSDTELILGTDYVPLRSEYQKLSAKVIRENIRNVLVLSGGSDNMHILWCIMEKLTEYAQSKSDNEIRITAICGRFNPDYEELADRYGSDVIIQSVPSLKEYIQQADVVISAGGTTLYEICACGTPAITYSFADNQIDNVRQFEQDKLMKYAGDIRDYSSPCGGNPSDMEPDFWPRPAYERIIDYIKMYEDKFVRQEYSARMQQFVDGYGAYRIVCRIMNLDSGEK